MRSNTIKNKSLDYYITVSDLKSDDKIKFLGRDRNDQYHLYDSYNNSRVIKSDNENFLSKWLWYNHYRFKNLIDSTHQMYAVMSIERIKRLYDENGDKKYTTKFSGQC